MQTLRRILAVTLVLLLSIESTSTLAYASPAASPLFRISLPGSLGYVSETYSPRTNAAAAPDMIFIQDLHANRSVQFAISRILKKLKSQGLMPDRIAVEGETGPVDIAAMQNVPDSAVRKEISDYLVQQAEMPGAMHFAVTEGAVGLFGIETDDYYQANLEMFRRSYSGRSALRSEMDRIQAVLPRLKKETGTAGENAAILEKDITAVSQLINNQVIPDELPAALAQASAAVDHLKQVLSRETSPGVVGPLAASVNFYALALLRNEELFKNALAAREWGHQKTSIVITGGFHTAALAEQCKRRGMSYAVITPNVRVHDKVDEQLYLERLLDHHLTPAQAASGLDWASVMTMLMFQQRAASLFSGIVGERSPKRRWMLRRGIVNTAIVVACGIGLGGCGLFKSPTDPSDVSLNKEVIPPPDSSVGVVLTNGDDSLAGGVGTYASHYGKGNFDIRSGDTVRVIMLATDGPNPDNRTIRPGRQIMFKGNDPTINPWLSDVGLVRQVFTIGAPQLHFIRIPVDVPIQRSQMGLNETSPLSIIQVLSGRNAFGFEMPNNEPIDPITGSGSIIYDRMDRMNGPAWKTAFNSLPNSNASPLILLDKLLNADVLHAAEPGVMPPAVSHETTREIWLKPSSGDSSLGLVIPAQTLVSDSTRRLEINLYAADGAVLSGAEVAVTRGQNHTDLIVSPGGAISDQSGTLGVPAVPRAGGSKLTVTLDLPVPAASGADTQIRVTPKADGKGNGKGRIIGFTALQKALRQPTFRSVAFFVMMLAAGIAVLGLHPTPAYAAELGLGSNAMAANHVVQSVAQTAHAAAVQQQTQQAVFSGLQHALGAVDLKTRAIADAIFAIPVGIGMALASPLVSYRLKKKLEALRNQSAIWAAA